MTPDILLTFVILVLAVAFFLSRTLVLRKP